MEKRVKIQKEQSVVGVLYDGNNNVKARGDFRVISDRGNRLKLKHEGSGNIYETSKSQFDQGERIPRRIPGGKQDKRKTDKEQKEAQKKMEKSQRKFQEEQEEKKKKEEEEKKKQNLSDSKELMLAGTEQEIITLINAGFKNIWLKGPAGSGKTTITGIVAEHLNKDYLVISCGEGTSPTEFRGRIYPKEQTNEFIETYQKDSIIVLDEFTALLPETAQILNAALANERIATSVGVKLRNPNCIIIATSNTFGTGADAMYVANNQIDASTIDRFTGAIIEVGYSSRYESQFDKEVVETVNDLRECISENLLQRIMSTRSIIMGDKLKNKAKITDWKERLLVPWSPEEREIAWEFLKKKEKERKEAKKEAVKGANGLTIEKSLPKSSHPKKQWNPFD